MSQPPSAPSAATPEKSVDTSASHGSGNLGIAFGLSLASGILILLGSGLGMGWALMGRPYFGGFYGGMMGGSYYPYMMGGYYGSYFSVFGIIGLVSGIVILASALLMRSRPYPERRTFGVLILVFSLVSLAGMGGFFIGAVLGIVGGILALA